MLAATVCSYLTGLLTPRYKSAAWLCVGTNVCVLFLVKLQPITGMEVIAPLGMSYFTLRIISYNVDIYLEKYLPVKNLLYYGLYITYLPSLFLGPIDRFDHFYRTAIQNRHVSWDNLSKGTIRLLWGVFKKLVIASRAGVVIGTISAEPEHFRGTYALFALLLYSAQLYADFSGGIDMVLGVSKMLGISLKENFNTPYFSESIAEFWRRWHMTLGSWLRDYVYIPLGGNRKGEIRKLLNTLITFLISGLWHGVHYMLWGFLNGVFVFIGDHLKSRYRLFNQLGTFFLVSLLWAFFVWPETMTAIHMLESIFSVYNYRDFFHNFLQLGLSLGEWIVLFMAISVLWCFDLHEKRLKRIFCGFAPAGRIAIMCTLGLIILIFGMYGIGFNAEEFIYSRF